MLSKITIRLFSVILLLSSILLLSCNKNNPTSSSPSPTLVKTGSLRIDISGIANGLKADITVTGPNNYNRHFDTSVIIDSIPVGTYSVTARAVLDVNQDSILVTPLTQNITIIEGVQKTAKVEYLSKRYGSMQVNIAGLPTGTSGDITVEGGDNSTYIIQRFSTSQLLDSLVEGSYWVTGAEVKASDGTPYIAKPDSQQVVVTGGQTTTVSVNYVPKFGKMSITVTGLPGNTIPTINVNEIGGNGNYSVLVNGSRLLDSLRDNNYTVVGQEITASDGTVFKAKPETQVVTVTGGQTTPVIVNYVPQNGYIAVGVSGLPSNTYSMIKIYNGGSYNDAYGNVTNRVFDLLEEGAFQVIGMEVQAPDGTPWVARPDTQHVSVIFGDTVYVSVKYVPKYGKLDIMVNGLPPSILHKVWVHGPSPFTSTLFSSTDRQIKIDSLEEGTYKVIGQEVTGSSLQETYIAKPDTQTVTVTAGQTTYVTVNYDKKYARLDINISGLPGDASVQVVELWNESTGMYDGLGFGLTRHWMVDTLVEGNYRIVSYDVTAPDGTAYSPRFDTIRTYIVPGDEDYSETIVYRPKYGKIDLRVTGLPNGLDGDVSVTVVDQSYAGWFGGSTVIDSLVEGTYWVVSKEVVDANNNHYKPERDSLSVYLIPPSTAIANVKYKSTLGALKVDVSGLQIGVSGNITIRNEDQSQLWSIESSEVIDSMPEGDYTVLAYEVTDIQGDTLTPKPDSQVVTIVAGDTTVAKVEYNGLTFKIFTSLHDGTAHGGILTNHDNSQEGIGYTDYDVDLVRPLAWEGCLFTEVDITDSGYSRAISGSLREGSISGTESLVISKQDRSFELTNSSSVRSDLPAATYDGTVSAQLFFQKIPYLQIENPNLDTLRVVIHWDVTATAAATNTGYSSVIGSAHSWMHLSAGSCFTNVAGGPYPAFNAYVDGVHDNDTAPLTGDTTLVLVNMPQYIVCFDLNVKLLSASHYHGNQNDGLDGEGTSNAEITTVISVSIEKN